MEEEIIVGTGRDGTVVFSGFFQPGRGGSLSSFYFFEVPGRDDCFFFTCRDGTAVFFLSFVSGVCVCALF